jgi:hypothetical protein
MFRQIMRTRFLIRKPGVERRAGHGFGVFPSGWHGQNNTRTFWIGKPLRTTSGAAGPKGISLGQVFSPIDLYKERVANPFHASHSKNMWLSSVGIGFDSGRSFAQRFHFEW